MDAELMGARQSVPVRPVLAALARAEIGANPSQAPHAVERIVALIMSDVISVGPARPWACVGEMKNRSHIRWE